MEGFASLRGDMQSDSASFLITSMHESALHGWRLVDGKGHADDHGYPSRVRSMSWSAGGREWLATSGADSVIMWPFQTKGRPDGQGAQDGRADAESAPSRRLPAIPRTACAAQHRGYADGTVLMIRFDDSAEMRGASRGWRCHLRARLVVAWFAARVCR